MKKIIFILFWLVSSLTSPSQIYFKIDATNVIMKNGSNITINSTNIDVFSLINGGTLQSEEQINTVSWNIGTNLGIYTVPFTNILGNSTKIEYNIISAGIGSGNILFSVAPTRVAPTDDSKLSSTTNYPTPVLNMNSISGGDNSLNVVNRFWFVDYKNYTTKPSGIFKFYYSDIDISTVVESNLQSQYWDNVLNKWILPPSGTVDVMNNNVGLVSSQNNSSVWTLVDKLFPLPIELLYFKAECNFDRGGIDFIWETASEMNSDYFVLEYSIDGNNWLSITKIPTHHNSSTNNIYTYEYGYMNLYMYYRLKEVDYDGNIFTSNIIIAKCENIFSKEIEIYPNPVKDELLIDIKISIDENINVFISDCVGKEVYDSIITNSDNPQIFKISLKTFMSGVYILKIYNKKGNLTQKIIKL